MAESSDLIATIQDPKTGTCYVRGRFLGKGGFARCYEFSNVATNEVFAVKIVSKSGLTKPQHKSKMSQEIAIHKSLDHPFIVKFHSFFEDPANIYIILELCRRRSLMEMHKRRKALTVEEVRYFMRQITIACKYLHDQQVIHRDLKLGNLFLNDNMEIKVGDFGLATRLQHAGERKRTLCGTPNYIAPEILNKAGHSYEVDLWSLGCIMYTLLVGMPPFETSSLKETYAKIRNNEYFVPRSVDEDARDLITKLLHPRAEARPSPSEIMKHSFFVNKLIPRKLPTSCLTMPPRRSNAHQFSAHVPTRKPLLENNVPQKKNLQAPRQEKPVEGIAENKPPNLPPPNFYVSDLFKQLDSVIKSKPEARFTGQHEDIQDPSLVPFIFISKWIDYSDKYGLGYCFCDNSKGVSFSDDTHIMILNDERSLQYTDCNGQEIYFTIDNVPGHLGKKKKLLDFFINYMAQNLSKTGETAKLREIDEMTKVPIVRKWIRTEIAIMFHLTNGTLQINFLDDHTKIIVCPIMNAISYIDERKNFIVYSMKLIEKYGCSKALSTRIRFAMSMSQKYLR